MAYLEQRAWRAGMTAAASSIAASALILLAGGPALAAAPKTSGPSVPAAPAAAPGAPAAKPPAAPELKYMQLQAQYKGPLQDTVIQRWRDPIDGTVCYVYLPVVVEHSAPTPVGAVQYGSNNIGSISCLAGRF